MGIGHEQNNSIRKINSTGQINSMENKERKQFIFLSYFTQTAITDSHNNIHGMIH